MSENLVRAAQAFEACVKRATLMTKLQALADSTNGGSDEDTTIGYLLRVVWVAVHTGHIDELDALVTPLADKWMGDKP